jgi:hypothetical protein
MKVYDEHNRLTKIIGLVRLAPTQIKSVVRIDSDAYGSAAIWRRSGSTWKQPSISELQTVPEDESWYHLFTESGTFRLCGAEGEAVRDFSDVGAEQLEQTYGWVLSALTSAQTAPAPQAALPHNLESFNRRTACPPELFSF